MAYYLIVRVKVNDPAGYAAYTALTPDIVAAHGGRFLVRCPAPVTLEGPQEQQRIVVVEFPDEQHARAFYDSAQYQAAKAIREPVSEAQFLMVPGV
ncbi:DUF1330 domain-containing protein [Advenella sp. FME57]|uniref:DUF1330 domain-containing protein n=1 Tax=Advenella kashmirensis TaxID=310575 RepID=A0A356LLQ9_9BURK|nr:DUF1330 domain-containing protein [Advenella sp. FME57]HBP31963.1 DUF1330 domain-containing protein [Advenella kashmirensis]